MASDVIFLTDLGLIAIVAFGLSIIFARLGLPIVVGQLIAGILIGPYGFGLISNIEVVELLASLGIVLLMFVIGLELNPSQLFRLGTKVLIITSIEMGFSFVVGLMIGTMLGFGPVASLFLASVLSISSTAIIGRMIISQWRIKESQSHLMMGLLVVEDIVAIVLMLILPSLAITGQVPLLDVFLLPLKGLLLFALIAAFGYFVAPRLLNFISQYEIDLGEASFLLALGLGFFFGVLAAHLGYSPAIGAFLAGLMVVGKPSKFMLGKLAPIRELFVTLFFISMGSAIDVRIALPFIPILVLIIILSILSKLVGGWLGALVAGTRVGAPIFGLTLIPRGEFSFIITKLGIDVGVLDPVVYTLVGITTLVSAIVGPLSFRLRS